VPSARMWNGGAPFFDVRSAAGLTAEETRRIEARRKVERMAKHDEARVRRDQWTLERGKAIAAKTGVPEDAAAGIAREAAEHRILRPDFLLVTDDGEMVTVGELLASSDKWHGRRFGDPLEPDYRGDNRIAWANLRPTTGRPYLYSHAHGGTRYALSNGRPTIRLAQGDLPAPGQIRVVEIRHHRVGVMRVGDEFHALADRCPHRGAPLCSASEATTDTLPVAYSRSSCGRQASPIAACSVGVSFSNCSGS